MLTRIAGIGVAIPIAKLNQFVKDVIVIDGPKVNLFFYYQNIICIPASESISPTRSFNSKLLSVRAQLCRKIKTSSTPIANIKNGTTVTIGKNSNSS